MAKANIARGLPKLNIADWHKITQKESLYAMLHGPISPNPSYK